MGLGELCGSQILMDDLFIQHHSPYWEIHDRSVSKMGFVQLFDLAALEVSKSVYLPVHSKYLDT